MKQKLDEAHCPKPDFDRILSAVAKKEHTDRETVAKVLSETLRFAHRRSGAKFPLAALAENGEADLEKTVYWAVALLLGADFARGGKQSAASESWLTSDTARGIINTEHCT